MPENKGPANTGPNMSDWTASGLFRCRACWSSIRFRGQWLAVRVEGLNRSILGCSFAYLAGIADHDGLQMIQVDILPGHALDSFRIYFGYFIGILVPIIRLEAVVLDDHPTIHDSRGALE